MAGSCGSRVRVLIAAFLWINQLPDYHADISAGKVNVVVRLGHRVASRVFPVLLGVPFVVLAFLLFSPGCGVGLLAM